MEKKINFIDIDNNNVLIISEFDNKVLSKLLNLPIYEEKYIKFNKNLLSKYTHILTHNNYQCYNLHNNSNL